MTAAVRPAQGGEAAVRAISRAQRIIGAVREEGVAAVGTILDELDRADLYAVVVALAAMVPYDAVVTDLLAWVEETAQSSDDGTTQAGLWEPNRPDGT